MSCIEHLKLEQFVKGKLAPDQMLAVDSHIRECSDCKTLAGRLSSRTDFAAELSGAVDCPEYEELSAYLDQILDAGRTASIRLHANACELCTKDLERIAELRSHAAMREKISVTPGASRAQRRGFFFYWRQALAVGSLAGLIAAAVMLSNFQQVSTRPDHNQIAAKPPMSTPTKTVNPPKSAPAHKPEAIAAKPEPTPVAVAANTAKPAPMLPPPVLNDGQYSVIRKGDRLALAQANGTGVGSSLQARISARIDEKLRTGKIKLPEPVKMAMASVTVRGEGNGYEVQPAAPKPIGPNGKIVMSATPTFNWSAVDLAESYRVRVSDESGNIIAEQVTKKTSLTLAKPLARGNTYIWRVGVRFGETDSWMQSGYTRFHVLSSQDFDTINSVRAKLPGSHLALGAAYESVGLYEEAAAEYRLLRRANPNSKLAQKLLNGVTLN